MSASCLYEGTIRHRRTGPEREFCHRIALAYLDLDELPRLLGGRLVKRGPGRARFRRRDYLGDPRVPLDVAVRDLVEKRTGARPGGPIRLLTQLRAFGVCFNPVSFYYCYDAQGETPQAVVAEVTNTPWGERHAYVIPARGPRRVLAAELDKALHVSPFMGMAQRYAISLSAPGETLGVHVRSSERGRRVFDATLSLRRRPLRVGATPAALRVLALIYGHALGLKLAGAHVHPHPRAVTP